MPKAKVKTKKKKVRREIGYGVAHVQSTFNNTIITIADSAGNTVCWASSGTSGFKGARKGTPFAAQLAAKDVAVKAKEYGVRYVDVRITGPGAGRESSSRRLPAVPGRKDEAVLQGPQVPDR
jgi:small subunit ribosomal protein S11